MRKLKEIEKKIAKLKNKGEILPSSNKINAKFYSIAINLSSVCSSWHRYQISVLEAHVHCL